MTNQHPITPPLELVWEWTSLANEEDGDEVWISIATQAAQWGADQELEACCEWVSQWRCMVGGNRPEIGLRFARRLKPPTLKEQALAALREAESSGCLYVNGRSDTIRKALEALPND
jgi:hypothetical protein